MKTILTAVTLLLCLAVPAAAAGEKWQGIDESVIEKYAEERGGAAGDPFLAVEGDLLLFLFALAGAVGGFVIGYLWHKVFVAGRRPEDPGD